uniref:Uncharacterized protein n=1 Tax=Craspedostauros australis TaxID=1486917 RepID=A0A7R9WYZ7_9STRA
MDDFIGALISYNCAACNCWYELSFVLDASSRWHQDIFCFGGCLLWLFVAGFTFGWWWIVLAPSPSTTGHKSTETIVAFASPCRYNTSKCTHDLAPLRIEIASFRKTERD